MAKVSDHLSLEDLQTRFRESDDGVCSRHYQTIWLLARGYTILDTAEVTGFAPRWIEELLARYNALGADALGDRRRDNGATAKVLTPEVLERLRTRLEAPPEDGGVWTSAKAAAFMAGELGLERLAVQRGWEALKAVGWSIQRPRPRHAGAASLDEQEAFKKVSRSSSPRSVSATQPR